MDTRKKLRWWPAGGILCLAGAAVLWMREQADWSFQERNLRSLTVWLSAGVLLLLWWVVLSRAPWRLRLGVAAGFLLAVGLSAALFRIRGVSGDVLPILEPRWSSRLPIWASPPASIAAAPAKVGPSLDFPQFLGPHRTALLDGPGLERDWATHPPRLLWRQPIGAAWSGWAIVGTRALTQEQRGENECCTCYDALTGKLLWSHADPAHYQTTIAGEGPRCTPTIFW